MAEVRVNNFTNISSLSNGDELLIDGTSGVRNITYEDLKTNLNDDVAVPATYGKQNAAALSFDGLDGSDIEWDAPRPDDTGFAIECIFSVNSLTKVRLHSKRDSGSGNSDFDLRIDGGVLKLNLYDSGNTTNNTTWASSGSYISTGKVYHLIVNFYGDSAKSFLNTVESTLSSSDVGTGWSTFNGNGSWHFGSFAGSVDALDGEVYMIRSWSFALPTAASNPNSLPYTVEDAAAGKDVPVALRGSYSITNLPSLVGFGSYGWTSLSFSGNNITGTSDGSSRAYTSSNLSEISGKHIRVNVTVNSLSGGEIDLYFQDAAGGAGSEIGVLKDSDGEQNLDSFVRIDSTGSYSFIYDFSSVSETDIRFVIRFNSSGESVDIDYGSIDILGVSTYFPNQNLRIPSGHKQIVDASGNGNHATIAGGVEPTQEGEMATYHINNIDVTSNSFLISSSEDTIKNSDVIHYKITNNSGSSITGLKLQASDGSSNHFDLHTATGSIADGETILVTCDKVPPDNRYRLRVPAVSGASDISFKITVQKK